MRSLASRQQRARFAAAWRRDASSRVRQRNAARLLRASATAEARYVRDVVGVMRGVHKGFLDALNLSAGPELRAAGGDDSARARARWDAGTAHPFPREMERRLFVYVRGHIGPAHDRMGREVNKDNAEGLALLGIQPAYVPGLAGTIAHAREDNIRLVQEAAGTYATQLQAVLRDPANLGLRVEDLQKLVKERGHVSESRARFIARDQTLKLNAAISQARQTAAGVTRYTWSTSKDERVRPMHQDLEGTVQAFDDPPETNEEGETNNPGEDWQCRCVPLPVIPGLEEEEEPEEEPKEEEPEIEEPEPEEEPEEEIPGYPPVEEIPGYEVPDVPELEPAPEEPTALTRASLLDVVRDRAAALTVDEILGKTTHEGLRTWIEAQGPDHQPKLRVLAQAPPGQKKTAEGGYEHWTRKLYVNANVGPPPPSELSRAWGDVWRVADHAPGFEAGSFTKTALEKVQDNVLHELGHHVHLGPHAMATGVDDIVASAFRRTGLDDPDFRKRVLEGRTLSSAISVYAATNPSEYFAESFNAYMTEPAALKAHDPGGYTMVAQVLKRLGIER